MLFGNPSFPQAHTDPRPHQPFHLGHPHPIAHVRARLVRQPRPAAREQLGLAQVDVHPVNHDARRAKHIMFVQTVDRPQAGLLEARVLVGLVLAKMDMETRPLGRRPPACIQRRLRQGQIRMEPKRRRHAPPRWLRLATAPEEADILSDTGKRLLFAVMIRDLIAQHGTHPSLFDRFRDDVQRAVDGVGRGVMIDQGRRPMLDSVDQTHQGGIANILQIQGLVQRPTELAKDLGQILGRLSRDGHSPGERPIGMRMGTDVARHHKHAPRVQHI